MADHPGHAENAPRPNQAANGMTFQGDDAFKIAQAVYFAVTGKTEKISRYFNKNFRISYTEISQLHSKCQQMITQWNSISSNDSITFYHMNENKSQFSSFERSKLYDKSQTSPIESITYECNFLLKIPESDKPQSYRINVRMLSRVTLLDKLDAEIGPPFLRFFRSNTLQIEVEYTDYIVARSILATLESWVDEIEIVPSNPLLDWVQSRSHNIPNILHVVMIVISTLAFFFAAPHVRANALTVRAIQTLILSGSGIWLSALMGKFVGRSIEDNLDNLAVPSRILINKGDERVAQKFERKNKKSLIKAGAGLLLGITQAVLVGTMTRTIVALMFKYFGSAPD